MAWLIIEGIDRSGKSSVAKLYKEQGYELVHMSAPNKKYREPGYAGPSYLDDMLDMYMEYDGKDVIFDRSIYGETVWPYVYGRESSLTEDDIEVLREFEDRNSAQRILMIDPDVSAHWRRCVDNNEPLNQAQFKIATNLYTKMAHKYNFVPKQLSDFNVQIKNSANKTEDVVKGSDLNDETPEDKSTDSSNKGGITNNTNNTQANQSLEISGLDRLEKANAISAVLSSRIIKKRGDAFDELEGEVVNFLKGRLEELLGSNKKQPFLSEEEVQILKLLARRFMEKDLKENKAKR